MSALKAIKPEAVEKRLKLLVYGPAGVGKTTAAIQFPNAFIMDTEKGTDFYSKSINKADSAVLKTNDPDEIAEQLHALLTEKHPYKTLIIDPITQVYNAVQEKWTRKFEKHEEKEKSKALLDFGPRYWGRVKSEFKAIQRLMMRLDMNVIITSHQKDIYGMGMTKIGVGPDTMKGDEYIFDLVFELKRVGDQRMATTIKERAEIGQPRFPAEFEWNYQNFLKYYGTEVIEREAKPVSMATDAQVAEIVHLLDVVKVDDETVQKWFTKASVDEWGQMTGDQIQTAIDFLKKKLASLNGETKKAVK
jgi:hypothetical protein